MEITTTATNGSDRTRHILVTLALALLLVLAGCEDLPENGSPTEATPANGETGPDGTTDPPAVGAWPETETPEAVPLGDGDLPPGVDESGPVNGSRLVAAHIENRPAAPYHIQVDPVGPTVDRGTTLVLTQGETRAQLHRATEDGSTTYWASAERLAVAVRSESGVTYALGRSPAATRVLGLSNRAETAVLPYVRFGTLEAVGAVELGERHLVKLRLTGLDGTAMAESPWEPVGPNGTVEAVDGTVLVSQAGVIYRARLDVTYSNGDGEPVTDTLRYRLDDVAEPDLQRPEWASRAPHVHASLSEDATAIVLENVGGRPIAAGTELTVTADGDVLGTVAVPERVAPDERLYVSAVWGEEDATTSVRAHLEPPDATNRSVDLRRFDAVVVEGRGPDGVFQAAT